MRIVTRMNAFIYQRVIKNIRIDTCDNNIRVINDILSHVWMRILFISLINIYIYIYIYIYTCIYIGIYILSHVWMRILFINEWLRTYAFIRVTILMYKSVWQYSCVNEYCYTYECVFMNEPFTNEIIMAHVAHQYVMTHTHFAEHDSPDHQSHGSFRDPKWCL